MDTTTRIEIRVRRKGRVYVKHWAIFETSDPPDPKGVANEIGYMIKVKGIELMRDILYQEKEHRVTNPFAWS